MQLRRCEKGDVFVLLFLRVRRRHFLFVVAFGRLRWRRLRGFFVLNRAFGN
jgi:hypothetical protein